MTKKEVFEHINTTVDRNGSLKTERRFMKEFPGIYMDYRNTLLPECIGHLPFKQKIWHFLNDVYEIPVCKVCGKPVSFETKHGIWGYRTYCSGYCAMQDGDVKDRIKSTLLENYGVDAAAKSPVVRERMKNTCLERYGVGNCSQMKDYNEKVKETNLRKYGSEYYSQTEECRKKVKETLLKKYGVDNYAKTDECKLKIQIANVERYGIDNYTQSDEYNKHMREYQNRYRTTCIEKYGVDHYSKTDECKRKQYDTKKLHNSFNVSSLEVGFENYLKSLGIHYKSQYKSEKYPYSCDFFIDGINLYVEIQGNWTHGGHPFNGSDESDMEKLKVWEEKSNASGYYRQAIYTWTDLDVRKRRCAEDNNINYLEIFSDSLEECIDMFETYVMDIG